MERQEYKQLKQAFVGATAKNHFYCDEILSLCLVKLQNDEDNSENNLKEQKIGKKKNRKAENVVTQNQVKKKKKMKNPEI